MRILYYNWIQFDNASNKGGGVNLYQKNLIDAMLQNYDHEIFFLSSGREYRNPIKDAYIQKTDNCFGDSCQSYTIVNSPILATGNYLDDRDLTVYLEENSLYQLLRDFIAELGGIDVIHFNNLEGLSLSVFRLKEDYPKMRMIYSLHNYFPFCPQVNLWSHNRENCINYCDGKSCTDCHDLDVFSSKIKEKLALDEQYEAQRGIFTAEKYRQQQKSIDDKYKAKKQRKNRDALVYRRFREETVTSLNYYADKILAVSDRVKSIAISMGIQANKIQTSYIGTKIADRQLGHLHTTNNNVFTMAYLGYMRHDKGFYFFLETCEQLATQLANACNLVFAAKISDTHARERIELLKKRFHHVIFYDGYTHETLEEILAQVDLGIVPVLWEDNLPQIAIEMVSMGVPVLCSHLGGAKELTKSRHFCFQSGNKKDFEEKLQYIMEHPQVLHEYFSQSQALTTMKEHVRSLQKIYKE